VPYGAAAKRQTVVQRAAAAQQYAAPRNIIYQYEPVQVRIVRQFQRLGVTQANPQAYLQQYGASLLDAATLVQQARAAGVVEDISAPAVAGAVGFGASTYGQEASFGVGGGYAAGAGLGGASSFESSNYSASGSGYGANAGFGGAVGYGAGAGGLGGSYESSSSSFEASSLNAGGNYGASAGVGGGYGSGFDVAGAAFRGVDSNNDGAIDRSEFARFYQQGL
jgi:hypothetical protein